MSPTRSRRPPSIKSKAQLGDELEIVFSPGLAARDPERYLDYALGLPGRIADADRKQVVVFFDEFQEIGGAHQPYGDSDRLTKRMRAIFQRTSGVSYLFAGSLEHLMRDLFTPSHRGLHQFGGFHDLRPIDAEAWAEGLSERFEADDCEVEPAALERIVEYGEGQPRSTMLIAQKSPPRDRRTGDSPDRSRRGRTGPSGGDGHRPHRA